MERGAFRKIRVISPIDLLRFSLKLLIQSFSENTHFLLSRDFPQKMASALSENPASVIHSLNLAHNTLDNQGTSLYSVNSSSLLLLSPSGHL